MKTWNFRAFPWECTDLQKAMNCKQQIRALFGIGNHSIHITDTHEESKRIARIVFHNESIRFLNNAEPTFFGQFEGFINLYSQWLKESDFDGDCFCIDGSAVLSAYGLRDCNDLDFLHSVYTIPQLFPPHPAIGSHNFHAYYYDRSIDDILFRPENYFYYRGLKFAGIDVIKRMKKSRGEPKDHRDVSLINKLFHQ